MTAFSKLALACVLAGGLAAPALAAPGDAGSGPTTGATPTNDAGSGPTQGAASSAPKSGATTGAMKNTSAMNGQHPGSSKIVQKMRNDLSKAGFTDIQIMPSSFLVRGKDSSGNPVMMVVNPDSITAITEENSNAKSANNSSHMGGGAASNSTGATPGPASTGGSQPVTPGASQTKP